MKIKRLPKSFVVGAQKYKVIASKTLDLLDDKYGMVDNERNIVYIQVGTKDKPLNLDKQRLTLRHEQIHAIGFALGVEALIKDEKLVDNIALLLDQMLESEEF